MNKQSAANIATKHTQTRKIPVWLKVIILPLWVIGILFLSQLIFSNLFRWIIPQHILTYPWVQSLYIIISDVVALLIIILVPNYLEKKHHITKKESTRKILGLLDLLTWKDILLSFIGYFVYLFLSYLLFRLFSAFPWFNPDQAQDLGYTYSLLFGIDKIITMLALIVVVPIVEEVLFRGFLYGKLKRIMLSTFKKRAELLSILFSTLIVSLAFALLHGQWNVGVDVFAMSVVLCIMREISGSIYPGILVHIIKNTLAFFVLSSLLR
ncbi:CPBP family intramembrane metalloprotease [Candidatus Saccharibacteria bacterium]|nr:CPBP family intramembrane metalloprotease [Candidatus Saccharibacteria bacterium]